MTDIILKQASSDPVWLVTLQVMRSNEPSLVVGLDGRSAIHTASYYPPSEITVHAPNAEVAHAYAAQQNPGALVHGAVQVAKT